MSVIVKLGKAWRGHAADALVALSPEETQEAVAEADAVFAGGDTADILASGIDTSPAPETGEAVSTPSE